MNKFEVNPREPREAKQAYYPYGYSPEFQVTYTPLRAGIFRIWLYGGIEDTSQFIYAIEALNAAGENDIVEINLSTPGGNLDATDTFIMAMQDCQAKIIVKASGGVHSAGTVILLQADEFFLSDNFNALVHNGSCGSGGKFNEFVAHSRHTQGYMEKVMRQTYAGFLTDEELEALLEGKDFWMDAKEFADRFANRNEYLQGKHEEAQEKLAALMETLANMTEEEPESEGEPEIQPEAPKRKRTNKSK